MDKAEETKREQSDQENAETPKVEDVEVEFPSPRDLIHDYDVEWDPNKFEPEDVKTEKEDKGENEKEGKDGKKDGGKPISERGTETFHEDLERLKGENHAAYTVLLVMFLAVLFPLVFLVAIPLHAIVQGLAEAFRTAKDDYSTAIDLLAHGKDDEGDEAE